MPRVNVDDIDDVLKFGRIGVMFVKPGLRWVTVLLKTGEVLEECPSKFAALIAAGCDEKLAYQLSNFHGFTALMPPRPIRPEKVEEVEEEEQPRKHKHHKDKHEKKKHKHHHHEEVKSKPAKQEEPKPVLKNMSKGMALVLQLVKKKGPIGKTAVYDKMEKEGLAHDECRKAIEQLLKARQLKYQSSKLKLP